MLHELFAVLGCNFSTGAAAMIMYATHLLKRLLLLVLLSGWLQQLNGQYEESNFTRYSTKDGLSENYIRSIQQDDWGYLWVATEIGLNRFDGKTFTNYYQGARPLRLPSSLMVELKRFGPHQLGILSRGGFQILNTKDYSVRNFYIPDTTALTTYTNHTWDAIQLDDQSFAVTTPTGFYVFDAAGKLKFRHDAYLLRDVGHKRIRYGRFFYEVGKGQYIVTTEDDGVAYYDAIKTSFRDIPPGTETVWDPFRRVSITKPYGKDNIHSLGNGRFIFIHVNKDSIACYDHNSRTTTWSALPFNARLETDWASKILKLNDSSFAITSSNRGFFLFTINLQTNTIHCQPNRFLPSYKVNCLFLDKEKRLWVGTTSGILKQRINAQLAQTFSFAASPYDFSTIGFKCAFPYKGKLYLGRYSRYQGLTIVDMQTMQVEKQLEFYGRDNFWNEVSTIQMYHPDTLWLGTNSGILWFDTKSHRYGVVKMKDPFPPHWGHMTMLYPKGNDDYAWFCYQLNGVAARYHIPTRQFQFFTSTTTPALPFDKIKRIVYDAYGDVWLGGHSLARWNNRKQQFDTMITVYAGPHKFNDDILTMAADNKGSLWFHNAENGLLEYQVNEKKYNVYSMEDGLPTSLLNCFSPVVNDSLWIGSNKHLTLFNTRTKKTEVYDHQDGVPESPPSARQIFYDKESNRFYMTGKDHLVVFPSSQKSKTFTSKILVRELVVENKNSFFYPSSGISFPYNQDNLTFHFDIIDFDAGNSFQMAYRLNNDENWTKLEGQRSINLNGLSPGRYTIYLEARGKTGLLEAKEFQFRIRPPFWKTNWFYISAGLLLLMLGFLLYRYRIRHIRQKANIDKQLAETEMKALHAQMNPHFVFNSLNSISEMILNNENKDASHYLSKFAHLIRATLDQSGKTFVSLRTTMDYLERYAEMEQVRNSHFSFNMTAAEDIDVDEIHLPPMLIQPFIENAIWHGMTETRKNIDIRVNFFKDGNQLVCTIDDNGIGINQAIKTGTPTHRSVGISNIRHRIQLLNEKHDMKCSLAIQDKSELKGVAESGTLVTLRLEIKET